MRVRLLPAVVHVLAHGAVILHVKVRVGCGRVEERRRAVAQEIVHGQAVRAQFERRRAFARADDCEVQIHFDGSQPGLSDGVVEQEGVVGDLNVVVVARLLARLEVPDAQPRPTTLRRGRENFEHVGTRGAELHAPRVKPEVLQQPRLLPRL